MTVRNLTSIFAPKSVAVIGASDNERGVGGVVMRNLMRGGFKGPIMPVNPKHRAVAGVVAYPDVASLPIVPDLAVICTPAATVPAIVAELGARGTRGAVVLSAGFAEAGTPAAKDLERAMLNAARPHLLRIVGPNCLGILVPAVGLNASFGHIPAQPGGIAFLSQSGALCTAVLDWAATRGIGFSHFVSMGNSADVDFGDLLDFLAADPGTHAILLYIESVTRARKFMSAARAASRNKPVIAIKSGRAREGARAASTHTGALAGADDVYAAALARAGILRVDRLEEMFEAVETLARARPIAGNRLVVLSNGGGPGVIAVDALIASGGELAELDPATLARLDAILPATWSRQNPIDMIGDSPPERYEQALKILIEDPAIDAVLVMHAPTALMAAVEPARAVAAVAATTAKNVLTCWLGGAAVAEARRLFAAAGVATFSTPESAVRAFVHMVDYRRSREALMETPSSAPVEFAPATAVPKRIVADALAEGRTMLSESEAKTVLAAYGVPVVETRNAGTVADAARLAREIGYPVALKILSPDITHKSDVGGVALDLDGEPALRAAGTAMTERLARLRPNARLAGFTVQRMARRPDAYELLIGVTLDPVFGPVVAFGQGGIAVEVVGDRALALAPLNMKLARDLIERTRIVKLLRGFRSRPAVDLDRLCLTLIEVSQLIVDVPEIVGLDINPVLADATGIIALDARIALAPAATSGPDRLAIRPYPRELEEDVVLSSGLKLKLRPIRPEDEPAHQRLFAALAPADIRFRFFNMVREFPHSQMARYTQIDYDREMALVATAPDAAGIEQTYGVVRAVADPDNERAEFAVIVRSDIKGQGLGRILMERIIAYCRNRGTREIVGEVLRANEPMLALARALGFRAVPGERESVTVIRPLA